MTEKRILELAYNAALFDWAVCNEKCTMHPENKIFQHRKKEAWEELEEVERILVEKYPGSVE